MTFRGVTIPLLVVLVLFVGLTVLAAVLIAREANAQQERCNPQGACVDVLDHPHVMRRLS